MLLSSTDPKRLRDWYVDALGAVDRGSVGPYLAVELSGFFVLLDSRDDVSPRNLEPRIILNVDVPDARAAVDRLDAYGVEWVAPLEDRDGNYFATVLDPDGNYVQLLQFATPGPLDARAAFGTFSVDDVERARAFYGDVLGLTASVEGGMLLLRLEPGRQVLLYPKPNHVPASHTVLNFPVADIALAVDALTERGVVFERYPGMAQDERGVLRDPHSPPIAWFRDPAGNTLAVLET
jgi:predicted enzyme related to lactoylglutathione lyase